MGKLRQRIIEWLAQGGSFSKYWSLDLKSRARTLVVIRPWNGKSPDSIGTCLFVTFVKWFGWPQWSPRSPPRLTLLISGTGAALSKLHILTQCFFLFLNPFRSAPYTRLCFLSFSQILPQRLLLSPVQAYCRDPTPQTSVFWIFGFTGYPLRDWCSPLWEEQ